MENFKQENNKQPSEEKPQGLIDPYSDERDKAIYEHSLKLREASRIFLEEIGAKHPHLIEILKHPEKYDRAEVEACRQISRELGERQASLEHMLGELEDQLAKLNLDRANLRIDLLGASMITGDKEPESTEAFVIKKDISGSGEFNQN
jgi:hypothetical protein